MRGSSRRRHHEDEEESAFVSMTDLTVSFLFIIMILLAWSASKISKNETVPKADFEKVAAERNALRVERDALQDQLRTALQLSDQRRQRIEELERRIAELERRLAERNPLEIYMQQVAATRVRMLEQLRTQLRADIPDLQVEVSQQMDALHFKGDGLFRRSASTLAPDKEAVVRRVATRLNAILPCYTLGKSKQWRLDCNAAGAVIEAVQIEGHTDSTGTFNDNIRLSTERANETFFKMTAQEPGITSHSNFRDQPVLSVAGYGAMRPIAGNDTEGGQATNRRIDLRIIMYAPKDSEEIESIKIRLRDGVASAGSR